MLYGTVFCSTIVLVKVLRFVLEISRTRKVLEHTFRTLLKQFQKKSKELF